MGFCTKGRPWVSYVPADLYSCTDKNLLLGKFTRVDLAYLRFLQRGSPRENLRFNELWTRDAFVLGFGKAHQGWTLGLTNIWRSETHQGRTLGFLSLWRNETHKR